MAVNKLSFTPSFSLGCRASNGLEPLQRFPRRLTDETRSPKPAEAGRNNPHRLTPLKRGVNETIVRNPKTLNPIPLLLMSASVFSASLAAQPAAGTNQLPIVTANTGFALDLYQREKSNPGDLFFSPYSLSTALAMTYSGARGQTAAEMARVLHFNLPQTEVPVAFGELKRQLDTITGTKSVKLDIAN